MPTGLTNNLQDSSIALLLIVSAIGGIIGASIRFFFDYLIPDNLKKRKKILDVKNKYAVPIFYSLVELRKRLKNVLDHIKHIEKDTGWLSPKHDDDYYLLSTLYLTARFFGWTQILRRTVIYLDLTSTRKTKSYSHGINAVLSSFSNPALLQDNPSSDPGKSYDKWIFSIQIQAIGDLMIIKEDGEYQIMDFATFCRKIKSKNESEFQNWLKPLIDFYINLTSKQIRFRRLAAILGTINAFLELNDPKHLRSDKCPYYWSVLVPQEQKRVINSINSFYPKFKGEKGRQKI